MAIISNKNPFPALKTFPINFTVKCSHSAIRNICKKIKLLKLEDEKGTPKPLCVILGWGGSKQMNLKKYSEIFVSRGYNAITVTPSLADILVFPETKGKKISLQVLDTIKQNFSGQSTVLFPFSNTGCGLYYFICKELYDASSPYYNQSNIVGSIFDSCPIEPSTERVPNAQTAFTINIKNPIVRNLLWYSLGLVLPFLFKFNSFQNNFMDGLRNSPLKAPRLFMYSKGDAISPYTDIIDFIEHSQRKGINVMKMVWEETPHVSHLQEDPVTYSKILNEFLDNLDV